MDKSWVQIRNHLDPNYVRSANEFMIKVIEHKHGNGRVSCPCIRCFNARRHMPDMVRVHILDFSFDHGYTVWWNHGESTVPAQPSVVREEETSGGDGDRIEEMLNNAFGDRVNFEVGSSSCNANPEDDKLFANMETLLFRECEKFSKLSILLKLMHVKVTGKVMNSAMDSFLQLLSGAFFKDGSFPKSHYEVKKYLHALWLGYQSIQACESDCALFWKENDSRQHCPVCGTSWWDQTSKKGKKIPHKVLRYFPVKSRLKRIYSCRKSAKLMQWHDKGRSKDLGVFRHPTNGKAWHHFDGLYPAFATDPINVLLGLASDNFNPFGNMSLSHSTWQVVLIPYNMPPQMCMDDISFMMTLLIPGPTSLGKDIDVYL